MRLAAVDRARSATSSASRPARRATASTPTAFRPPRDAAERAADREAAGLDGRLAILTVGGIEPRKGSLTLLEGFAALRARRPSAAPLLVVAGGATLFDYRDEIGRFHDRAAALGLRTRVRVLGPVEAASSRRSTAPPTCSPSPRPRRASAWRRSRRWPRGLPVVASDLDVFRGVPRRRRQRAARARGDAGALADALVRVARDGARAAAWQRRPRRRRPLHLGRVAETPTRPSTATSSPRAPRMAEWPRGHSALAAAASAPTSRPAATRSRSTSPPTRRRRRGHSCPPSCSAPRSRAASASPRLSRRPQARDRGSRASSCASAPSARGGSFATRGSCRRSRRGRRRRAARSPDRAGAQPFCWVSNTLAAGVEVELWSHLRQRPFRIGNTPRSALQTPTELAVVLDRADHLGPVFARHAYGMRAWVDLFSATSPGSRGGKALLAGLIAVQRAPHAPLPRARGRERHRPRRVHVPRRGRGDLRPDPRALGADELVGYALGSLDHFAAAAHRLPRRGRAATTRRRSTRSARTSTAPRAAARARGGRRREATAADAHELYRVRELAEVPLYAHAA